MSDRGAIVERLFLEAMALEPHERAGFLEEASGGDRTVRAEVEELLTELDGADDFFDESPTLVRGLYEDVEPSPKHPVEVADFKILDVLGEGGMGVVYLAESQFPKRRVALKVIRPGFATANILKRFEHETHVLGLLHHPGIAQIYEAGMADTGAGPQPFFAMEYVEGERLSDWLQSHRPALAQRLELVAGICDAVQHAHAKGVIHRDLKPANILVDDEGRAKILDFGVARLTESDLAVTSPQTDVGQLVGTLAYMSPEQVTGDPTAIDSRSDVYALGVLLYEVLSGNTPHDVRSRSVVEVIRCIKEDDPPSLSSCDRMYRGDVDTIVAKALEKERDRRYQTAAELAADLRRFLNDEPIVARPASTAYQLRKFARRNRGLVAGVVTSFVILVVAVIALSFLAIYAQRQRDAAVRDNETKQAINDFLNDIFAAANPMLRGRDPTIRELLRERESEIRTRFADRPEVRAELHATIGSAFLELAETDLALHHLQEATTLLTELRGASDERTVDALVDYGSALRLAADFDASERELARAKQLAEQSPDHTRLAFRAERELIRVRLDRGDESTAEQLTRDFTERARAELGEDDEETLYGARLLGTICARRGQLDEAGQLFERVVQGRGKTLGEDHIDTCVAKDLLAGVRRDAGRYDEAEVLLQEIVEVLTEKLGHEGESTLTSRGNLAKVQYQRALRSEMDAETRTALLRHAAENFRSILVVRRERNGPTHERTVRCRNNLAATLLALGQAAEAETMYRDLLRDRLAAADVPPIQLANARTNLAMALLAQGSYHADEALTLAQESYDIANAYLEIGDVRMQPHIGALWKALRTSGLTTEATRVLQGFYVESLPCGKVAGPEVGSANAQYARDALVGIYRDLGDAEREASWAGAIVTKCR